MAMALFAALVAHAKIALAIASMIIQTVAEKVTALCCFTKFFHAWQTIALFGISFTYCASAVGACTTPQPISNLEIRGIATVTGQVYDADSITSSLIVHAFYYSTTTVLELTETKSDNRQVLIIPDMGQITSYSKYSTPLIRPTRTSLLNGLSPYLSLSSLTRATTVGGLALEPVSQKDEWTTCVVRQPIPQPLKSKLPTATSSREVIFHRDKVASIRLLLGSGGNDKQVLDATRYTWTGETSSPEEVVTKCYKSDSTTIRYTIETQIVETSSIPVNLRPDIVTNILVSELLYKN